MTEGSTGTLSRTKPGRLEATDPARNRKKVRRLMLVGGARPNFMKLAPLVRALRSGATGVQWWLVHTGQHYDQQMSQSFFDDLQLPEPDFSLGVGSGSHAEQTAAVMVAFEKVCLAHRPDMVVVVGDVNSTLACAVVAAKLGIGLAHVEAGLRSFDRSMPEEINRLVTDTLSDLLFVTERQGIANLMREGRPEEAIHFVGHVMVDNLLYQRARLEKMEADRFAVAGIKKQLGRYGFVTLHRPANVDDRGALQGILEALGAIARDLPLLFPVHPRTRKMLASHGLELPEGVYPLEPLGFMEALYLWQDAELVLTDSGGLQEETTALGVPCFTLRQNTERPVTITEGTNTLVGPNKEAILQAYERFRGGERKKGRVPELWDGKAAERIVQVLLG